MVDRIVNYHWWLWTCSNSSFLSTSWPPLHKFEFDSGMNLSKFYFFPKKLLLFRALPDTPKAVLSGLSHLRQIISNKFRTCPEFRLVSWHRFQELKSSLFVVRINLSFFKPNPLIGLSFDELSPIGIDNWWLCDWGFLWQRDWH